MTEAVPVRDAATIILVRDPVTTPRVLMGQRGREAAFMPDKFVFPGGRVDPGDAHAPLAGRLSPVCRARLDTADGSGPDALAAAAIRELWEETGQILAHTGARYSGSDGWTDFAPRGLRPDAGALSYVFRAITPPGPARRFDARFFLANATSLHSDPDDFSAASDELSNIRWVDLDTARALNLPFITRAVLAHVADLLPAFGPPDVVPFYRDGDEARARARLAQGYTT